MAHVVLTREDEARAYFENPSMVPFFSLNDFSAFSFPFLAAVRE